MQKVKPIFILNRLILKSAPLDRRFPVSPKLLLCFSNLYLKPTTPKESSAQTFCVIKTEMPGLIPKCNSFIVVSVRLYSAPSPLAELYVPFKYVNVVSLNNPNNFPLSSPTYERWNKPKEYKSSAYLILLNEKSDSSSILSDIFPKSAIV